VLAPDAAVDWDKVVTLARKGMPAKGATPEALRTLAAALSRAGKDDEAAARLREAAGGQPAPPEGVLLLALVQGKRGDGEAARKALAEATAALDAATDQAPKDVVGISRWWQRQAELRLLRQEAEEALKPKTVAP